MHRSTAALPRSTWSNTGYATSHYKASRGYCDRGMFWRTAEGALLQECEFVDINGDGNIDEADRVKKDRYTRIRIQDVLDGTSKTIAVGESAYFIGNQEFPMWMGTYVEDGSILFKTQNPINCNLGGPRQFPYVARRSRPVGRRRRRLHLQLAPWRGNCLDSSTVRSILSATISTCEFSRFWATGWTGKSSKVSTNSTDLRG